jgi:hypothetical protein
VSFDMSRNLLSIGRLTVAGWRCYSLPVLSSKAVALRRTQSTRVYKSLSGVRRSTTLLARTLAARFQHAP